MMSSVSNAITSGIKQASAEAGHNHLNQEEWIAYGSTKCKSMEKEDKPTKGGLEQ